jgi:hypothetical protein
LSLPIQTDEDHLFHRAKDRNGVFQALSEVGEFFFETPGPFIERSQPGRGGLLP